MTSKTITFSFKNPTYPEPQVTSMTEGGRTLTGPAADATRSAMNIAVKEFFLSKIENAEQGGIEKSQKFTVSIELPPDDVSAKLVAKLVFGQTSSLEPLQLTRELSQTTKESLNLKALFQPDLSLTPLNQAHYIPLQFLKPSTSIAKIEAAPSSNTVPSAPSHNFIYAFFSAIGHWFMSFFPSSTAPKSSLPTTLPLFKRNRNPAYTPPSQDVLIQPLHNGNNICFINAAFQALMNTPKETKKALVNAHEKKIRHENYRLAIFNRQIQTINQEAEKIRKSIRELTKDDPWGSFFFTYPEREPLYRQLDIKLDELPELTKERDKIRVSKQASMTLINAIKSYNRTSIWLNDLRGFDPSFGSSSQEDACQLLDKIFESLGPNLLPLLGEENLLVSSQPKVDEADEKKAELANKKDVSNLPENNLLPRVEPNPIVRIEIPEHTISLQDLLDQKFNLQNDSSDELFSFISNKQRGWYRVSQKKSVINTQDKKAPEFIPLQLKRFSSDQFENISKLDTAIELPENNILTLIVNGQKVNYEIQSLIMQSGSLSGGHYYSYVKKGDDWYIANDSSVSRLGQLPDNATQAYMLFLKKA